jgi:hypothetical protein
MQLPYRSRWPWAAPPRASLRRARRPERRHRLVHNKRAHCRRGGCGACHHRPHRGARWCRADRAARRPCGLPLRRPYRCRRLQRLADGCVDSGQHQVTHPSAEVHHGHRKCNLLHPAPVQGRRFLQGSKSALGTAASCGDAERPPCQASPTQHRGCSQTRAAAHAKHNQNVHDSLQSSVTMARQLWVG